MNGQKDVHSGGVLEAMSHDVSGMSLVKNPPKKLGEIISRIDSSRDVKQLNVTPSFPVLNSKESDIYMPGSLSRFPRDDNGDSRFIIFVDLSRTFLREAQFRHNRPDVPSSLGSSYSSNKLRFSSCLLYTSPSPRDS